MTSLTLGVRNIGGIEQTRFTADEGVTLLVGENASSKTSLLRALLFALGADDVALRTGTDQGMVELTVDGHTVRRTVTRKGDGHSFSGTPLLDVEQQAVFTRFGGLLESNPLRTAVESRSDFETLLKEPMDLDVLERERSDMLAQKRSIQERLDAFVGLDDGIERLEADRTRKETESADLEAELSDLYEELPEQESALEDLRTRRADILARREQLRAQIADTETALDTFSEEIADLEGELAAIEETPDPTDLQNTRAELRGQLEAIDERVEILQSALTANRDMLGTDMQELLAYDPGLDEDRLECWACGDQAPTSSFEAAIEQLQQLVEREKSKRREYEPAIAEIESEIDAAREKNRRKKRLENRLESAHSKRDSRRSSLDEKRTQHSSLEADLEDVDSRLEQLETERAEDRSGVTRQIEQTRVALEATRHELERLETELEEQKARIQERKDLQETLHALETDIHELTARIENRESKLRAAFNEAMDELLDVLRFDDVERIWLDGQFELVIAREVDGTVREDSVDNLAESERGMIGLVLGLGGYLAYDVESISPVLVIDSLGAFDGERTQRLLEFFGTHTTFLVAAVHPEQVTERTDDHQTVLAPGQQ